MPCRDGRDEPVYDRAELDTLTRLLCDMCRSWKGGVLPTKELQRWWGEHWQEDEARQAILERKAELDKLAKKALAKLTKEERNALGLP